MNPMPQSIRFATLFLIAALGFARADILAFYPFSASSYASTDTDLDSTASDIVLGSGITGTLSGINGGYLRFSADNFADGAGFQTDDDFGFSISSPYGIESWESLDMDVARSNTGTSFGIRLMSRVGAGAFTQVDISQNANTAAGTMTPRTFDLSSLPGLSAGETREFRIEISRSGNTFANSREVRFDNIELNAIAIPEPGSLALVGLSLLAMVFLRRR